MYKYEIGFIGAGNMGEAIISGILQKEYYKISQIAFIEKDEKRGIYIEERYSITRLKNIKEITECSKIILLATKPGAIAEVCKELKSIKGDQIIVSIAAGVKISTIENIVGSDKSIVRIMPNTPALVLEGMSALSYNKNVNNKQKSIIKDIFDTIGKTIEVDEKKMDSITGLSGSGPAFIFTIIEAMADGGVLMGLTRKEAYLLAAQTIVGAGKLFLEREEKHPGILKDMVTSPGGTTIEGIFALEKHGVRAAFIEAIKVATEKSIKLGKESEK